MGSREYQGSNAWEGLAHFYAAYAFNNGLETNCYYWYGKNSDWDQDGSGDTHHLNCEGAPKAGVAASAHYDNQCNPLDGEPGFAGYDGGTEYDWLRTYWDLLDAGLSVTDIFDIVDLSDSGSWDVNGAVTTGTSSDDVYNRMLGAADDIGEYGNFDFYGDFNGIDH